MNMLKLNTWLGFGVLTIPVVLFAGWVTHIITCFQEELWGFLIAGAIMFPIGIIHGIWLWF
jgi:sulfite exporter TauE/SafE